MCWDPSFVVIPEVIVLLEAGGFELTLWSTLAMTRRADTGGSSC
jgi:hypothetical protein